MPAKLLAGQPSAEAVLKDVEEHVKTLKKKGITPGLGTVLVGADSTRGEYVRKKHETCEQVVEVASWITPRLVGVGPTTVAMLLRNTFEAAERTPKKLE